MPGIFIPALLEIWASEEAHCKLPKLQDLPQAAADGMQLGAGQQL